MTFTFEVSGGTSPYSITFDNETNTKTTEKTAIFQYVATTSQILTFNIIDAVNTISVEIFNLTVYPQPNIHTFSVSNDDICFGEPVKLTDNQSSEEGMIWHWYQNGDKQILTTNVFQPEFTENINQIYTFDLQVENQYGCLSNLSTETVRIYESPVATIENIPETPLCAQSSFQLKNGTQLYENGLWTITDKTETTKLSSSLLSHTPKYDDNYTINVQLDVAANNCSSNTTTEISVSKTPESHDFAVETDYCFGETIEISDNVSTIGTSERIWKIDGKELNNDEAIISFKPDNNIFKVYTFSLQIKSVHNCLSAETIQTFNLHEKPVAKIDTFYNNKCFGDIYTFILTDNTPSEKITSGLWHIENQQIDLFANNPLIYSFSLNETRTYPVILDVSTGYCTSSKEISDVEVYKTPEKHDFSLESDICTGEFVEISDNITTLENEFKRKWMMNNEEIQNQQNAIFTTNVFDNFGQYTFSLQIVNVDNSNCISEIVEKHLQVNETPNVRFTAQDEICAGVPFTITNTSSVASITPKGTLFIGINSFELVDKLDYTFTNSDLDITNIRLEVGTNDCSAESIQPITIFQKPDIHTFEIPYELCFGTSLQAKDITSNQTGTFTREWKFGDGAIVSNSTDHTVSHIYTSNITETYNIGLRIKSGKCYSDAYSQQFTLNEKPTAIYTFDETINYCYGDFVSFSNTSSSPSLGFSGKWFVDEHEVFSFEEVDTNKNLIYSFNQNETLHHNVRLMVTTDKCTHSYSDEVMYYHTPVIGAFSTNAPICYRQLLEVTDESNYSEDYTRIWNFGDNIGELENNNGSYQHEYTTNENSDYGVTLKLKSKYGCISNMVNANVRINEKPTAKFSVNSDALCYGKTFLFTENAFVPSETSLDLKWYIDNEDMNFGGGIFSYNFPENKEKIYTVKIIAETEFCADVYTHNITVYEQPIATFNIIDSNVCYGENVLINNASSINSGSISANYWNFGDKDIFIENNENNISHFYIENSSNDYDVKLYCESTNNCISDTTISRIEINRKPVSNEIQSENVCFTQEANFTDNTDYITKIDNWMWDFGNSVKSTSSINDIKYTYNEFGKYSVKLVVISNDFCKDTIETDVEVYKLPNVDFEGKTEVCANEFDCYYKTEIIPNETLEWQVEGDVEIVKVTDSLNVHWFDKKNSTGTIILNKTDNITGCKDRKEKIVRINNYSAPDKVDVIFKNEDTNTNILIYPNPVEGLTYQWGYIENGNTVIEDLENWQWHFWELPHVYKPENTYFVIVGDEGGCRTTNTYNENYYIPDNIYNNAYNQIVIYPNPCFDSDINIKLPVDITFPIRIKLYNMHGKKQFEKANIWQHNIKINNALLNNGVNIIELVTEKKLYYAKIIKL